MDEKGLTYGAPTAQPVFTVFPSLPIELRLKIWAVASQVQRVLELNYAIVDQEFYTYQNPPSVLHVSGESREVGLQYYRLSFGNETQRAAAIYFNPTNDIIYLGSRQYSDEISYMIEQFSKQTAIHERILNLAITENLWCISDMMRGAFAFYIRRQRGLENSLAKFFECFPHLQQLIFVKEQGTRADVEHDMCLESACRDHSGIALITATPGDQLEVMSSKATHAVGRVLQFMERKKTSHPDRPVPKFAVMEYDLSLKQCGSENYTDSGC